MNFYLKIITLLTLMMSVIGCSSHVPGEPEPLPDNTDLVTFTLNIYAGDPGAPSSRSRANELGPDDYFEGAATDYERMHTLRIIIVRPDNTVEHNEYIYRTIPAQGASQFGDVRLKVVGGEKKRVYLFANEASILANGPGSDPYDFNALTIGSTFPVDQINDLQLTCTPGTPLIDNSGSTKAYIPMSECFECDIRMAQIDGTDREQSADLFITRAAVKFGFFFTLTSPVYDSFTVNKIEVSELSNTEFLIPRATLYAPGKYPSSFADRYIYEYTVPSGAKNNTYTFTPENVTFTKDHKAGHLITYTPAVYFPETQLPEGHKYKVRFFTDKATTDWADIQLPNLPSLPRNTYVKINASINPYDLQVTVDILPYTAVPLNPEFGFDDLLPRPPVITGPTPPWVDMTGEDGNPVNPKS